MVSERLSVSREDGDCASEPPQAMLVSDCSRVTFERAACDAANANDERAYPQTWRVTIRSFLAGRIIARWSIRRDGPAVPLPAGLQTQGPDSVVTGQRPLAFGASEHAVAVARGQGDRWHTPPGEGPLGSSEWLAQRPTCLPETEPGCAVPNLAIRGPSHLGASENCRKGMPERGLGGPSVNERWGRADATCEADAMQRTSGP